MNFLVCISRTPDTTSKIVFDENSRKLKEDGLVFILNPYDEWFALVRAIELKEKHGGSVAVLHIGSAAADVVIRKSLAIGADAAYRIDCVPDSSYEVAKYISDFAKTKSYDLILLGKETIDHNGSETASMVAEFMDYPFISYCNKLEIEGTKARVSREIEGGVEVAELELPFVLSAAKGLAEQRIPNMKGIMEAKNKPLTVLTVPKENSSLELIKFELPPAKSGVQMIAADDMDTLIRILHEEAKVI
jgi:electron transfer flavoprotein beta subunit